MQERVEFSCHRQYPSTNSSFQKYFVSFQTLFFKKIFPNKCVDYF